MIHVHQEYVKTTMKTAAKNSYRLFIVMLILIFPHGECISLRKDLAKPETPTKQTRFSVKIPFKTAAHGYTPKVHWQHVRNAV